MSCIFSTCIQPSASRDRKEQCKPRPFQWWILHLRMLQWTADVQSQQQASEKSSNIFFTCSTYFKALTKVSCSAMPQSLSCNSSKGQNNHEEGLCIKLLGPTLTVCFTGVQALRFLLNLSPVVICVYAWSHHKDIFLALWSVFPCFSVNYQVPDWLLMIDDWWEKVQQVLMVWLMWVAQRKDVSRNSIKLCLLLLPLNGFLHCRPYVNVSHKLKIDVSVRCYC